MVLPHFFLTALALVIDGEVFRMHADVVLMWVGRTGGRPSREWCKEGTDKSVWHESNSRLTSPSCANRERELSILYI